MPGRRKGKPSKDEEPGRGGGDDEDMLDRLVEESLHTFSHSDSQKVKEEVSSFSDLHSRLMAAGSTSGAELKIKGDNKIEAEQCNSALYNTKGDYKAPPLRKNRPEPDKTLGKGWFNIQPLEMTEDLKRDIKIIQMRNYLNSKRFYKNPDRTGKVLHVGTVLGGFADSKSSRLTKKERKQNILDEVLADKRTKKYTKEKYLAIQHEKSNKRKTFRKKTFSKK